MSMRLSNISSHCSLLLFSCQKQRRLYFVSFVSSLLISASSLYVFKYQECFPLCICVSLICSFWKHHQRKQKITSLCCLFYGILSQWKSAFVKDICDSRLAKKKINIYFYWNLTISLLLLLHCCSCVIRALRTLHTSLIFKSFGMFRKCMFTSFLIQLLVKCVLVFTKVRNINKDNIYRLLEHYWVAFIVSVPDRSLQSYRKQPVTQPIIKPLLPFLQSQTAIIFLATVYSYNDLYPCKMSLNALYKGTRLE